MKETMSKPLVTVAMPFYNNQDSLGDAISSVLNQSFIDWELILINDGSTDKSLDVARKYINGRTYLISDGQNKGLVARLNQSVSLANGKYYARMDADDIMHPERLMQQVQFLSEHPHVDVVDTAMYVMNQSGELTGIRNELPADVSLKDVLYGQTLNHATVMGRADWFKSHSYDPVYVRAEDVELWCRTLGNSVFARLRKNLYFVREGKINVKNYARAQSTMRRIYRNYGPLTLSRWQIQSLILVSTIKSVLYAIMGGVGMQEVLTKLRNRKINPSLLVEAEQDLSLALKRPPQQFSAHL